MQTSNIMIYLFCYVIVFVLSWITKINNNQRLINDEGIITPKPGSLIGSHIIGILWLGFVPVILLKHSLLKVLTGNEMPGSYSIFLYILLFVLTILIVFKKSEYTSGRKQGSIEGSIQLSTTIFIRHFTSRALFIFTYELWFRGFLLFDCISWVGIPAAVIINVFLYVLLHIFNNKREMWACIPFGILTCFLSIIFNAAWPSIILHIAVSLVYEFNKYWIYLYSYKTSRS